MHSRVELVIFLTVHFPPPPQNLQQKVKYFSQCLLQKKGKIIHPWRDASGLFILLSNHISLLNIQSGFYATLGMQLDIWGGIGVLCVGFFFLVARIFKRNKVHLRYNEC